MKKLLYVLCLLFCSNLSVFSQIVSEGLAQQVAVNFLSSIDETPKSTIQVLGVQTIGEKRQPSMYAISTTSRWILVAGDQRVEPILAYSDGQSGVFPSEEDMSPAMEALLMWYESQIEALQEENDGVINPGWGNPQRQIPIRPLVPPLLGKGGNQNVWGQSRNSSSPPIATLVYNKFCPASSSCSYYNYGHTLAGCNAVAMGQIMWYWKWPKYTVAKTDVGQYLFRDYDWSLMPYQLSNESSLDEANSVATLLHDAGTSINTIYGCNSTSASPNSIPYSLRNVFGLSANNVVYKSSYSDSEWRSILKNELDNWRPIIYVGFQTSSMDGGHTFVIDGYDIHNKFHVNFGWRGLDNGYYYFDSIYSSSNNYQFNYYQEAITGICISESICNDTIIPVNSSFPIGFVILRGGGITIGNNSFSSNKKGRIYSGQYVRLTSGTQISAGADVHIAIKDELCTTEQNSASSPSRLDVSTSEKQIDKSSFSVSPNPAQDFITISCVNPIVKVTIFDFGGRMVLRGTETQINVSSFPAGVYVVHVQTDDGNQYQAKFIKQ